MGVVIPFPTRPDWEPELSKRQLALHFGFSTRWVELRVSEGMPSRLRGNRRRFLLSEVAQSVARRTEDRMIIKRGNGYGVRIYRGGRQVWVGTFTRRRDARDAERAQR